MRHGDGPFSVFVLGYALRFAVRYALRFTRRVASIAGFPCVHAGFDGLAFSDISTGNSL